DCRAAGDVLAAVARGRQEDRLARRRDGHSRARPVPASGATLVDMTRTRIAGALAILAVIAIAWTLAIWITGGVTIAIGGIKITSFSVWRPVALALVAAAIALGVAGSRGARTAIARISAGLTPRVAAIVLAA